MPAASAHIRSPRAGSSANNFRRCSFLIWFECSSRAFHAERARAGLVASGSASASMFDLFWVLLFPKPESSGECVGIVARAAAGRHFFQFLDIAAAQNHVVGFEGSDKALHHIGYVAPPFLSAILLETANPDIIFEDSVLVRKMAQFHGLDNAVYN